MRFVTPGKIKDVAAFAHRWHEIAPDLGCDLELHGSAGPLGRPFQLGDRTIGNRFCIHPMEGWDGTADGLPTERTLRRWGRFGTSGAKLIWGGEAFAVSPDGRANPHQLHLNPRADSASGLAQLLEVLKREHAATGAGLDDLYTGLQLTHSGRYARPDSDGPKPRIAYRHPVLDQRVGVDSDRAVLTDGELEAIAEAYVVVAKTAQKVGFDFVDVKCCHGYLLHELLGARARPGRYGGSFENRTLLVRRIIESIRSACPGLEIGVRVSIAEVFPHAPRPEDGVGEPLGWQQHLPYEHGFGIDRNDPRKTDLTEPLRFLGLLQDLGIRLVNLSLGSPYTCPHLQRPAAFPPSDGYLPPDDPLTQVAEHLRTTRRCKAAHPNLTLVGTGYTYLQEWLPNVAQHEVGGGHVDFVGLGRMVLSYPELPRDVLHGGSLRRGSICRTFSDCTSGPRKGMISGCFPLDPYYRQRPEAKSLRKLRGRKE